MSYFTKLKENVPVDDLLAQLAAHPELWDQYSTRRTIQKGPHGQMQDIWVRYNDIAKYKDSLQGFNDEHVPVWYPAWKKLPALKSLIFDLMAQVEGEMLGGVLITRIPAGCGIEPHTDKGWHVEYYDKFYLSLKSGEGAAFHCGDEFINPKPGDLYHFDNRREHWVTNDSKEDRITLIICIRTDKFKKG